MIGEYLEAEHKGGGKDYINIEIRVKADCVHAFANSVRDATVDLVLEIIDRNGEQLIKDILDWKYSEIKAADILVSIRKDVEALKGGDAEYERIQAMDWKNGDRWYSCESVAIHNGTPLPKGHGRLIDERKMMERLKEWHTHDAMDMAHYNFTFGRIIESPTIIEADKENSL